VTLSVDFVLLREGSSDDALVVPLQELVVRSGAHEATGTSLAYRGSIEDKLQALLSEGASPDLIFIHRDADTRSSHARRMEIRAACEKVAQLPAVVSVVPIQETEAWLLVDPQAIRDVVGRTDGTSALTLPKIKHIESTSDPKSVLATALLDASDTTGRRHRQEIKRFSSYRRLLLERLNPDGAIQQLSSWVALVDEVQNAMASLTEA
jgi:hypothetical protein